MNLSRKILFVSNGALIIEQFSPSHLSNENSFCALNFNATNRWDNRHNLALAFYFCISSATSHIFVFITYFLFYFFFIVIFLLYRILHYFLMDTVWTECRSQRWAKLIRASRMGDLLFGCCGELRIHLESREHRKMRLHLIWDTLSPKSDESIKSAAFNRRSKIWGSMKGTHSSIMSAQRRSVWLTQFSISQNTLWVISSLKRRVTFTTSLVQFHNCSR